MKSYFFLLLFCSLLLTSCVKDYEEFIPDPAETNSECSIFGFVKDEEGLPIPNALVTYIDEVHLTDANGVYIFNNVEVGNKHNFIVIEKEGYFTGNKVFRSPVESSINLETILARQIFEHEFDALQGGVIQTENVRIEFQPNSIIYEDTGLEYTGQVMLAIENISPNDPLSFNRIPGDFSGINKSKQISVLRPFGITGVQLVSTSGEVLNLAENKKATLSVRVPSELIIGTLSELSAWHFDEEIAYWVEESIAVLDGEFYVSEVSHFSYWAYMLDDPAVVLSGKIVDENNSPLSNMVVAVNKIGEDFAAMGFTNIDGTFSGLVPKDFELELHVFGDTIDCQDGQLFATYSIDPLVEDASLPDFTIEVDDINVFTITGIVEDCDTNPLQNGYAIIDVLDFGTFFTPISNGQFSSTNFICGTSNYELTLYDLDNVQQSESYSGITNTQVDVGTVSACGTNFSYVTLDIPEFGINNFVFLNNSDGNCGAAYSTPTNEKFISANYENPLNSEHLWMNFQWFDLADPTILQTGTYDIHGFNIAVDWNGLFTNGPYTVNNGEVNIQSGGVFSSGSILQGSYNINLNHVPDNQVINATGSFYIKL